MREGKCPNCGGEDIYAARNGLGLGNTPAVGIRPHVELDFRGVLIPHQTRDVWHYACVSCGLVETFLLDPAALDFVRANWRRP